MNEVTAEKKAQPKQHVSVLYNGVSQTLPFRPRETVGELLAAAIRVFGIVENQHLLSLFNAAGAELPDAETLHAAGVKKGDKLVLRPGVVKGG
ncbi:MAG TPA: hypothetical protein VHU14_07150 [Solirubrobacterales bacterium]|jgi:hypothetical protein|nr:hypothetical protein [Solirubrobacterales bacterium]